MSNTVGFTALKDLVVFRKRVVALLTRPGFIALTILGNSVIVLGALAMYLMEHGNNPRAESLFDTLYWAVATVTTVGDSNFAPMTTAGRLLAISMMLLGATFFASFTAIFASVLLSPEFVEVEKDIAKIEREVHSLERLEKEKKGS